MEWLSVAEAARELAIGEPQVRRLARAGQLDACRFPAGWLISADAVHHRPLLAPAAGRPLSPPMAWALLRLLDAGGSGQERSCPGPDPAVLRDRRARYRLRQLLADAPGPSRWAGWLRRRAEPLRVWVHPGVMERLAVDSRLHPGGGFAAAAAGVGIAAAPPRRFYVAPDDVDRLLADYHGRRDPEGQVELMVIPDSVPAELRPNPGPVPRAVALADLLGSADARERHEAAQLAVDARLVLAP